MAPADYNEKYAPRDSTGAVHPIGDKPMPEALASIIGRQKTEAMQRDSVLSRYAETHAWPTTFAVGSVASMLDPLNAASMFLPGVGEGALATRLGGGLAGNIAARAGAGAATGALLQAPVSALKMGLSPEEAGDYGMRDALRDVLYGAAGMAALHTGIGTARELLGRRVARAAGEGETPPATGAAETGEPPPPAPAERAPPVLDAATQNATMGTAIGEIAEGRPVDVQPAIDAANPEVPPGGYRTAKGSVYQVHEDGTTTRFKTYHPEHGVADQGLQPRSEATVYVNAEDVNKLGEFQAIGPTKAVAPLGDGRWGVKYLEGKDAGKFEARTVVTPETKPAVGLTPVEVFDSGKQVHFGNEITEVAPQEASPTIAKIATDQRALAREGYAPGVSRDELAQANEAVYGKAPEEAATPPTATAPAAEPGTSPASPELAAAEQSIAQILPENLHPDDAAALATTAEGITQADTLKGAFQAAAQCLLGLI
jgi:hypothetical protein